MAQFENEADTRRESIRAPNLKNTQSLHLAGKSAGAQKKGKEARQSDPTSSLMIAVCHVFCVGVRVRVLMRLYKCKREWGLVCVCV